jgi:hypothetical protein
LTGTAEKGDFRVAFLRLKYPVCISIDTFLPQSLKHSAFPSILLYSLTSDGCCWRDRLVTGRQVSGFNNNARKKQWQ